MDAYDPFLMRERAGQDLLNTPDNTPLNSFDPALLAANGILVLNSYVDDMRATGQKPNRESESGLIGANRDANGDLVVYSEDQMRRLADSRKDEFTSTPYPLNPAYLPDTGDNSGNAFSQQAESVRDRVNSDLYQVEHIYTGQAGRDVGYNIDQFQGPLREDRRQYMDNIPHQTFVNGEQYAEYVGSGSTVFNNYRGNEPLMYEQKNYVAAGAGGGNTRWMGQNWDTRIQPEREWTQLKAAGDYSGIVNPTRHAAIPRWIPQVFAPCKGKEGPTPTSTCRRSTRALIRSGTLSLPNQINPSDCHGLHRHARDRDASPAGVVDEKSGWVRTRRG